MTPVEFHFITPAGEPIVNAEIKIQISQAGYDDITPGILMPRELTITTDAAGKAMISLVSSDIMHYVTATDSASEAALFYKFIVPPLASGVTYVRLQDILVEGPLPQAPYDEAALLTILTAKANTLSAATTATTAAAAAATSASASAASATSSAAVLATVTAAAVDVPIAAAAAEASRVAAASAASAAGTSATAASSSQTAAATSATTATTKANEAAASATAAASSATASSGSAATATTAAGNASTSATSAGTSATAAAGSSTTATTQAGIAVTNAGLTAADRTQTNLDRIATAADRVQTTLDRAQTGTDHTATAADRVQTGLDRIATAADRVVTTADKVQTGLDKVATAADRVQTGLDRTAAATSASTATTDAATATTKASEAATSAADSAASAALAASTVTGVSTVNSRSGAVTLTSADVSLGNVNNTSDANKPVSTAQATADTAVQTAAATDATTKANAAQAAAIAASTPVSHLGSGGTAHANVVASGAAGFMTGTDKTKLDAITGANSGDETGARIATLHHAASAKTTLVDADELTGQDSAAGFGLIRVTWANIKATLATWIGGGTIAGSFTTLAASGNTTLGDAEATDTHTVKGATTVLANSASPAMKVTQTGAGDAFVVEDSTSPDSTPVVIDGNGFVNIGHTASISDVFGESNLQVRRTDGNLSSFSNYANDNNAGIVYFNKARGGSITAPTVLSSGDTVSSLLFSGYDGAAFKNAAEIKVVIDGTPGTNDMPGRLVFSTTADGASSPTERMRIDSSGNVLVTSAAGLGYGTGAGGTVTQPTSRTTTVPFGSAKPTGAITLFTAAGSATPATFTVTNAAVAATDTVVLSVKSGTNKYVAFVSAVAAGSFNVTFWATTGTASDAPVINFAVIKGATT